MTKVHIALPVYNEETRLEKGVTKLLSYLKHFPYNYSITIIDNASTDKTPVIAKKLSKHKLVDYLRLEKKGFGFAMKNALYKKDCDIFSFMDIDLSTDLKSFQLMINLISKCDFDLVIGNRLGPESIVKNRSFVREFFSRIYSYLIRLLFWSPIKDYQCGFKAIKADKFLEIIPLIEDDGWFFETELILLALKKNFKISQLDVIWTDDSDSKVNLFSDIFHLLSKAILFRFKLYFNRM